MQRLFIIFFVGLLFGCNARPAPQTTATSAAVTCLGLALEADITCDESDDNTAVLQSGEGEEVSLQNEDFAMTFSGRLQLSRTDAFLTITVLEGHSSIRLGEQTVDLSEGQNLSFEITDEAIQQAEATAEATEAETDTSRPEATPEPEAETPEATADIAAPAATDDLPATEVIIDIPDDCTARTDWEATYVVEAGDVLELIARDHSTTVLEMARANCLANPGLLTIGQVLRVPIQLPTSTPDPTDSP